MAGVWLAEIFGVLGEQATRKSARPKSRSLRLLSQDRTSGSISTSYSPAMHLMLYASAAIPKAHPSGAGGHVGGEDVVGVAVQILAGPVVAHRGPRISVAGRDLHIPQVHARVQTGREQ